jgi:hypothetical protein
MDIADYFRERCRNAAPGSAEEKRFCVYVSAITDTDRMLKGQELRVLTLDEVKAIGEQNYQCLDENIGLIWSEERNALNIAKPTYYDFGLEDSEEEPIHLYYVGTDFFDTFDQNTYGKSWRCWSSKPTEEQREAVKWED